MIIKNICNEIAVLDRNRNPVADAMLCSAATLVVSFWSYEGYITPKVMNILNGAAVILMLISWIYMSFSNGTRGKVFFPIYTAVFWTVPPIIYQAAMGMSDTPGDFSITLYIAGRICELMGADAFMQMPLLSGMPVLTASVIMAALSIGLYLLGFAFKPAENV